MQQQYQGYPNYLHQRSQFDYYSPKLAGFSSGFGGMVYNPYGGAKEDLMAMPSNWFEGAKQGSFDSWAGLAGVGMILAPMLAKKGFLKKKTPKQVMRLGGLALVAYSAYRSYQPVA